VDSGGKSHVTWNGYHPTTGGAYQIWYADNTSGAWSTPTQITSATGGNDQYRPQIAVDSGGKSHITWYGSHPTTGGAYQIWYADNTSGAWSAPTQITSATGWNDQYHPQIVVDSGGKSHITWPGRHPTTGAPDQIWYADNTSGAWSAPTQITSATGGNNQRYPQIAVDSGGKSHITWYGYHPTTGGAYQIWYSTPNPQVPTVATQDITNIGATTATGNGNITDLGIPNPTAHGFCWNTTGTPTLADSITDEGAAAATGAFTSNMTGLSANTTYHVRAYATNTAGTAYGNQVSFTTEAGVGPPPPDSDNDGLPDSVEQGPDGDNPNYDGNGDGIPD
jgi:hypothetical protein